MSERAGEVNRYDCKACGGSLTSVLRVDGTTPAMLRCKATPGCAGEMWSAFYRGPFGEPEWEWYRPPSTRALSASMRAHVRAGGLVLRLIGSGQDVDRRRRMLRR